MNMDEMEKALLDFKRELFFKDYEFSHSIVHRHFDAIETLRKWEITLLLAIVGYALGQSLQYKLPLLFAPVIVMFGLLESMARGRMWLTAMFAYKVEQTITSAKRLDELITNHTFVFTRDAQRTFHHRKQGIWAALRSRDFLIWNGSLILVMVILFLLL